MQHKFGGSIYLNGARYWWKVKFPGEQEIKQIPLKPDGSKFATKDLKTAELLASELWEKAMRAGMKNGDPNKFDGKLATLVRFYHQYTILFYQSPSAESSNIWYAIKPLAEFYPNLLADEFTPLRLKEFRDHLIGGEDYVRSTINRRISMIQRMFKWAASEILVSIHTYEALKTVEGLHKGRTVVRESRDVLPAPQEHIKALLPFMSQTAAKMMLIQSYTGMRSSEICRMTTAQIEQRQPTWRYKPSKHKTEHRGHIRAVPLGPKCQALLKPMLKPQKPFECIFLTKNGQPFNKDSYRQEFEHGFDKAKAAGIEIPYFNPHRIRHTVATMVRCKFDLDTARAMLGQRTMAMTQEYAELDLQKAEKVAKLFG